MEIIGLAIIFLVIALVYASAGFGGGSSYVALLLLVGLDVGDVRFTALVCNIVVVSGSLYNFHKAGILNIGKLLPLIILSVPLAFLGGKIKPDENIYKAVAAIALIMASLLMLFHNKKAPRRGKNIPSLAMTGIGGGIGFLSGFIGIGGGIFLAPILHLMKWDTAKTISAAASFFILVNSMSGLAGQLINHPNIDPYALLILGACVLAGGQMGNRLNIHILEPEKIRTITAILIGFVGWRILFIQIL